MQNDIRNQYRQALEDSHNGHSVVIQTVHSGQRGQPRIWIDPEFLRWAYSLRSTSAIARFLNVGRTTVRNLLLEHGIAQPQASISAFGISAPNLSSQSSPVLSEHIDNEFTNSDSQLEEELQHINLNINLDQHLNVQQTTSFTGPVTDISVEELDNLIRSLRAHYQRAGLSALDGMIRALGLRISRERIRQSLLRIDPVQRVFERISIRRRTYSVPGPNSLWHHDGQHGMRNNISHSIFS